MPVTDVCILYERLAVARAVAAPGQGTASQAKPSSAKAKPSRAKCPREVRDRQSVPERVQARGGARGGLSHYDSSGESEVMRRDSS